MNICVNLREKRLNCDSYDLSDRHDNSLRKSARSAGNKIRTKENPWENLRIVIA